MEPAPVAIKLIEPEENDEWQPRKTAQAFQEQMRALQKATMARARGEQAGEQERQADFDDTRPPEEEAEQRSKVASLKDWRVRYYHNDHLGTPRELSDEDGGIVWQATYRAWGNTIRVEAAQPRALQKHELLAHGQQAQQAQNDPNPQELPIEQNLRFQGQYFDEETGLHYNRFRYYDPDCGRFVSQDPIGLDGGENSYQYAPTPNAWIDPLGLKKKCRNCDEIECDFIKAKLQAYANQANAYLSEQPNRGLSPSQVIHVKDGNAWAYAMHYGTQLDKAVKDLVRADPILSSKVSMPAAGPLRPDFENKNRNNKNCKWFDLTTQKGWASHVSKYRLLGRGHHIAYSTPTRNF